MRNIWPESSGKFILPLLFLFIITSPVLSRAQHQSSDRLNLNGSRDLKIVAVMVEFSEDTNRFTSGNGTFGPGSVPYLENPGTNIDALPHNQRYFEAHLEFSKNYFETVSQGKLTIEYQVLPQIIQLDKKMAAYSPTGPDPDITILSELLNDVWSKVGDEAIDPFPFESGDDLVFVIFHAGIGRDVELTGTTLDKTPQDIPSVYLGRRTLRRALNDPAFGGFPIQNGDILVDHTLILPRTLSRAGSDAAGDAFVIPLSINGLLAAQIGSHLGLPDLFNTETGQSGIGRFGLMDGASIFSYNGLFPPEPSAWEKSVLGWATPFRLNIDNPDQITLPAASLRKTNSVAKAELSGSEYFLIENRHRDPENRGVTLTIKKSDGSYVHQTFQNDDREFVNQESGFDRLLEPGVIVDVSNFDFSLPGGLLTDQEIPLNGGILIWHIDETAIAAGLEAGTVNNISGRKGVDLEEADGPQDIGKPVNDGLFQNSVNGSPFDFWWSGNTSSVIAGSDTLQIYENRFAPDTTPNNSSNSGAVSAFELYDFSENLPLASFKVRRVNPFSDLYQLQTEISFEDLFETGAQSDYSSRFPLSIYGSSRAGRIDFYIPGGRKLWVYSVSEQESSFLEHELSTIQQPFINPENGLVVLGESPAFSSGEMSVKAYRLREERTELVFDFKTDPNHAFLSSDDGSLLEVDGTRDRIVLESGELVEIGNEIQSSAEINRHRSEIRDNELILNFPGGTQRFSLPIKNEFERRYTGLIREGNDIYFYLLLDGRLGLFSPDDNYAEMRTIADSDILGWPAFADFNSDGVIDLLYVDITRNQVIGINRAGTLLPSFPISAPENVAFYGTPLIADLDGDGNADLLVPGSTASSSNLYAFNPDGEPKDGFPLLIGGVADNGNFPPLPAIAENYLSVISSDGQFKVWHFPLLEKLQWASAYGNDTFNKVTGIIENRMPTEPDFSLLNRDETYNWPNPARDETTIRYQTREPAEIHIKIMTQSGRLLEEFRFQSSSALPNEHRIDTSEWASGAYYALVEAKAAGRTERKLVKIAIAR